MILTDKKIKSLIKKIQKKCEAKAKTTSPTSTEPEALQEDSSTKMFNEMKKLPFSE